MLAEALDTTKLPATKGEDGHEKKVAPLPLPAGFLSLVQQQAGAFVPKPKRPLLEVALGLGQSEAGAGACANLGLVQGAVDAMAGKVTKVRKKSDKALNWAMTQGILHRIISDDDDAVGRIGAGTGAHMSCCAVFRRT